MDTLGIEPRAFRMRGCDSGAWVLPRAREVVRSPLELGDARWNRRGSLSITVWDPGIPSGNEISAPGVEPGLLRPRRDVLTTDDVDSGHDCHHVISVSPERANLLGRSSG
jgi:hypothetical protein